MYQQFYYAKTRGCSTILGQLAPGVVEEKLVLEEQARLPTYQSTWQPAPPQYRANWHSECALGEKMVVNFLWSSQALQQKAVILWYSGARSSKWAIIAGGDWGSDRRCPFIVP